MLVAALVLMAANIALWIIFFLVCKKTFSADAVLEKIRGEVNALLMDIRQETDMSATLIEGRTNALKRLIDEADSRTLLAQKADENRAREHKVMKELGYQLSAATPVAQKQPAAYAPKITFGHEVIQPKPSTKTAALKLSAEGFSPDVIAEKLDISITEARMIVNLYGM